MMRVVLFCHLPPWEQLDLSKRGLDNSDLLRVKYLSGPRCYVVAYISFHRRPRVPVQDRQQSLKVIEPDLAVLAPVHVSEKTVQLGQEADPTIQVRTMSRTCVTTKYSRSW